MSAIPPSPEPRVVLGLQGVPGIASLATYRRHGGYDALARVLSGMQPAEVRELVKASGLRGRGGAGFPTGLKWGFVPADTGKPVYLCVNADESEPGTFKDRVIMEDVPHVFLEGVMIACYAIGCRTAFIYIRGEFHDQARILETAVAELRQAGLLGRGILGSSFDLEILVHRGAGAYICGEETALLESLEGKKGWPRTKPPFPAVKGLFGCPTVINNVETLAALPWIVTHGAEAHRRIGTEKSAGTKLFCLSGHVKTPCVVELPLGTNLREIIERWGGGVPGGRAVKGVIPGGLSAPVLTRDEIDIPADFETLAAKGSMLGSGGIMVMDETVCMVSMALNAIHFFDHESCGQCTPCREGTSWLHAVLERLERGGGREADLALVDDVCGHIAGRTICPFGEAAALPIAAFVRKFREEFIAHVRQGGCPFEASRTREGVPAHA